MLIMRLHSFDLKAVRAGARLAPAEARASPSGAVRYFSALLSALALNTRLLNASSVRLQRLVAFLLVYGINNIFAIGLFYFSNSASLASVDATDAQKQYDILEELLHDGSFVLMALIALGSAAHLTALCDGTARALQAGLSGQMAAWLAALPAPAAGGAEGGEQEEARGGGAAGGEEALLEEAEEEGEKSGGGAGRGARIEPGAPCVVRRAALCPSLVCRCAVC
jgi:hypothetical protein